MSTTIGAGPDVDGGRFRRSRTPEITVTVSDRWEDVREALAIVHDGFVESGYMDPQPSGRRMIRHYLTPGTWFYLAWAEGEPIAAMALLPDGPFGLPSDRAFCEELDALRATPEPLWECGSLALRRPWRRHVRAIAGHLMGAAARVFVNEERDGRVVISVAPGQSRFYAGLLGFTAMSEPRPLYGAPALLMGTTELGMRAHCIQADPVTQRLVSELVLADETPWFTDRRGSGPWPMDEVGALLEEQGCLDQVRGQAALLDALGLGPCAGPQAARTAPERGWLTDIASDSSAWGRARR
ncbi:MAG: hypothetical protein MUE51_03820 [Thermoleophilia bacterium]|nr:hypothetical protein [Thermoleophilia bacterium]